MPQPPSRINKSLIVKDKSGVARPVPPMGAAAPKPPPGPLKRAAAFVAKDIKQAALMPAIVGIHTAKHALPAAKNLATQPVKATKSGLAAVAGIHKVIGQAAASPIKTAKRAGPATLATAATIAATGHAVVPAFVVAQLHTPPNPPRPGPPRLF